MECIECICVAETGFGLHPDHKHPQPPSSTVLGAHSTVSAVACVISTDLGMCTRDTRDTRDFSSNFSTQLRRVQA